MPAPPRVAIAAGLAFTGAGVISLDYAGGNDFGNLIWGFLAVGLVYAWRKGVLRWV